MPIQNKQSNIMSEGTPTRRPYIGSCHCGSLRYVVYLTLPHQRPRDKKHGQQDIYRCNCAICHKIGILHVRVQSSPDDFLLLSPGDPFAELGDYKCDSKLLHFFYCRTCAVRCFVFMGEGEEVEVEDKDVLALEGVKRKDGERVTAWRPKKEGWQEGRLDHGCYLSVNALTIDPEQEGFDLREWKETGVIAYLDTRRSGQPDRGMPNFEQPHPGGVY